MGILNEDPTLDVVLVVVVGFAALVACVGFCMSFIRYFKSYILLDRRKAPKNPHLINVVIVEKVVEEEKVDSGPPRELTRREKAKIREKEREMNRLKSLEEGGGSSDDSDDSDNDRKLVDLSHHNEPGLLKSILGCFKYQPIKPNDSSEEPSPKSISPTVLLKTKLPSLSVSIVPALAPASVVNCILFPFFNIISLKNGIAIFYFF